MRNLTLCNSFLMVRNKPLWVPAFLRLVYYLKQCWSNSETSYGCRIGSMWLNSTMGRHMNVMASQIIGNSTVRSTVCTGEHQRKPKLHITSLLWGKLPVDSPHKGQVMSNMFPCYGVILSLTFFGEASQIARVVWPTWDPPGSWRPQVGLMLAPWTLLSGFTCAMVAACYPMCHRVNPEKYG